MVPEVGKKYGPYEILGNLGGGGMGYVYAAWDARLHREVAIKLLHDEYSMPGMRERFLREARAASALNHPNICTVFDIGEQNGDPYLVMELLQGQTLKDRIDYRTLQLDEILCIAREVAEALGAAHSKGVIHRDIKPANIFLVDKPNGSVQSKVLDFGLAKFQGGVLGARSSRSLELTAVGATVGTLAYMSPEQARGEVLDSRSDLFSLGVVLYEMATRHIPFPGATSALVFVQLLNHQPESVRNWNEAIPRELDRIIFKLMAKERTARFQTAQELEEALAKVGEKGGGWLRKTTSTVPLVRSTDPVARDRRLPDRKRSDSNARMRVGSSPTPPLLPPAEITPIPAGQRAGAEEPQFFRPVARVPRPDAEPQGSGAAGVATFTSPVPSNREDPRASVSEGHAALPMVAAAEAGIAEETDKIDSDAFAAAPTQVFDAPPKKRPVGGPRPTLTPMQLGGVVLLLLIVGLGAVLFVRRGHFHSTLLTEDDPVVLTEIENRTGDKTLDGAVTEALQIELSQSPYLRLQSIDGYRASRHQIVPDGDGTGQLVARNAARRLGATAYLFGSITGATAPYILHVDLLNVASNDVVTSSEERAPSLQQIPAAIEQLASSIRSNVGEGSDSITKSSNGLAREATTNLDALEALSQGDNAYFNGRSMDALAFYQQAATLDPKFVQAHLRLATLYRRLRAETAAADASKQALAAADNASERTRRMAQYQYEMNASGDYARAATIIRQVVASSPHDSEALEELARTLRLQGRVAEALQTAQQSYAENPYNVDAYMQAENALIGMDRFEAAAQIESQAEKIGLARVGGGLTAAYLGRRQDVLDASIASIESSNGGFRPDWSYGLYLDNTGHSLAGAALWRSRAAEAVKVQGLDSAAGFLLSQGAIDRALLGDCAGAVAMGRDADDHAQGITALFNMGMASALCGDADSAQGLAEQLQREFPQSFAVKGFYVADITAAIALGRQDPAAALEQLRSARQYDLISLTPVLRGRAHVALRQVQIGIVDFQTVLSHRGIPFIVGSVVYPVAQIGVARAFAETGDQGNSAEAYRRFLEMWKSADARQPLLSEARAHVH